MSDSNAKKPVSRRDTLKLATALGALGAGLGISLDATGASAEEIKLAARFLKIDAAKAGSFVIKLMAHTADGKEILLDTVDISALTVKLLKIQNIKAEFLKKGFSVEVHHLKLQAQAGKGIDELLSRDEFHVVQQKG